MNRDLYALSIDVEIKQWMSSKGLGEFCRESLRLRALELIVNAGAGFWGNNEDEDYLRSLDVLRKDRTANKRGRTFVCGMVYAENGKRAHGFELMREYRK